VLVVLLGTLPGAAFADLVVLLNGDRISGRVVARAKKTWRLSTPYGTLTIPRESIEKVVKDDGTEEPVNAPPRPVPTPPPPPLELSLTLTGDSFWQAWDPKAGADPRLRLLVEMDGRALATYLDIREDPGEIRGAQVNVFSGIPAEIRAEAGPADVTVAPPEAGAGGIRLGLAWPGSAASATLRVAYQSWGPEGWQDLTSSTVGIDLVPGVTAAVRVAQSRGSMEYTKKRMRNVETFRLDLRLAD
jgi:hypothetical protein